MSQNVTMMVLYFTDGALIEDLHVRKSVLRIPEIIQCLRENQSEFLNCDLYIAMMDQNVYSHLLPEYCVDSQSHYHPYSGLLGVQLGLEERPTMVDMTQILRMLTPSDWMV